jgi:hypothetical protein
VGNSANIGYIAKYDSDGVALWLRDIKSEGDADDCYVRDMVVDNLGDIYIAGVLGVNGRLQRTATTSDRTTSLTNTYRRPFVAKYTTAGALVWWRSPDQEGEFLSVDVDAGGSVWATGYIGSATDITSRTALLEKCNRTNGTVITTAQVPDATGCSVRTEGLAVFWLAMDPIGLSSIGGVKWGTSCFRACLMNGLSLNLDDLAWEVPVFGGLGERSDESDAVVADDGSVYVALNFTASDMMSKVIFPRRTNFSLVNRGRDGIVAQIGELPSIQTEPEDRMVKKGTSVSLTTVVGGVQTSTFQWYKEAVGVVRYETYDTITFPAITLAQSGGYKARVTKGGNSVDTSMAYIGVVDPVLPDVALAIDKKLTLTCKAAGVDLTYKWYKNGQPLNSDSRVIGTSTRTLTIFYVVPPDAADYTCVVTGPGGSITTDASTLTVLIPPVIMDFTFPSSMTSGAYSFSPPTLNGATSYTITGLPAGMTYNTSTGAISGRPSVPGSYRIRITATNLAGTSVREKILTVQALPPYVIARHVGWVATPATATSTVLDQGGRWSAMVQSNGTYTGTLTLGLTAYPISGRVVINNTSPFSPRIQAAVTLTSSSRLNLTADLADTHLSSGTVTITDTVSSATLASTTLGGWHPTAVPVHRRGAYTFGIKPHADTSLPRGYGTGRFTIGADGASVTSGRLADGVAYATSSFASAQGDVLIYQALYSANGSIQGAVRLTDDTVPSGLNHKVTGTVLWKRTGFVGERFSPGTFGPTTLSVEGGRYVRPSGIVMGLPAGTNNAKLTFSHAGLTSPLAIVFSITSLNAVSLPVGHANMPTLAIDTTTGLFNGSIKFFDPHPYLTGTQLMRTASFNGAIWLTSGGTRRGFGYFVLDQLPDANANPPTTPNTSPRLSGEVLLGNP